MCEVLHFPLKGEALLDFQGYAALQEARKDLFSVEDMLLNRFRTDVHIFYVAETFLPIELGN